VILYELLTGHRPYQIERRVHAEAVRVICEEEPQRPSTAISRAATRHTSDGEMRTITAAEIARRREAQLTRLKRNLAGDLDNVVMMAMRKSSQRRYSTAQALADDLVRHLEGQTVTARPPTFVYRAGKFLRRNRAAVSAAALILMALVLGFAGTTLAWQRSERALARETVALVAARDAEAAERDARAAAESRYLQLRRMFTIEDELYEQIENLPGATAAREVLTDAMLTAIGSLSTSFPDDPRLRRDLAIQYRRIGVLAAGGENSLARGVEALETARELLTDASPTDEERFIVGVKFANALWRAGQRDRAVTIASETADLAASIAGEPDAPRLLKVHHASALTQAAIVRTFRARYDDAADLLVAAIGLASEAVEDYPDDPEAVRALAHAHEMLGVLHDRRGFAEEELAAHTEALALRERVAELNPGSADARRRLVMSTERVGRALIGLERFDEARPYFERMRELAEAETHADPLSGRALDDLARSFENAGDLAVQLRQFDAAGPLFEAFLRTSLVLFDRDPLELNNRRSVALARYKIGKLRFQHGRAIRGDEPERAETLYAESAASLETAIAELRALTDENPQDVLLRTDLFYALRWIGYAHYRLGQALESDAERERLYEQGHLAFEQALAEAAAVREGGGDLAALSDQIYAAANGLCNIAYRSKRGDRIIAATDRAFDLMASRPTNLLGQRAFGYEFQGQPALALASVEEALASYADTEDPESSSAYRRLRSLQAKYQEQLAETGGAFDD
jgi:tetratricopeptide (TPR) repeat protein